MWGPTFFKGILENQINEIKRTSHMKMDMYHILLILTDGVVHDMKDTIDQVVKLGEFPCSIIVIGIGNADFANMDILDADDMELVDSHKNPARDIIQFVRFNKYSKDDGQLAEQVLGEVPEQLVEYMLKNGIKPKARESKKEEKVKAKASDSDISARKAK